MLIEFTQLPRIAYFSMEIALRNEIPTYAGGLGILAGDTLRSAADLGLPMVGVSLVSRAGYFRQEIDAQGRQVERRADWEPSRWTRPLDAKVVVPIEGRDVWVGGWLYILEGQSASEPVILLDTDLNENETRDREITHTLYGDGDDYRLKQEIVLGVGGVRMLRALDFEIHCYHLNEGHSALLTLELLRRYRHTPEDLRPGESWYDIPRVRAHCRFTTHTPVESGHDKFPYDLVQRTLRHPIFHQSTGDERSPTEASAAPAAAEPFVEEGTLRQLGGEDRLNMTRLALNLSDYVNGVATRHAQISREMFPGYEVHAITNGVHPYTWTCESFRKLYDRYLPPWRHEPEQLTRADCCIPDEAIRSAHEDAQQAMIAHIRAQVAVPLDSKFPILGFARRMTAYKRADLLFSDLDRLKAIARQQPFQIVLAGKAHPRDEPGKRLIEDLNAYARALRGSIPVVYLPDYDMALAQLLVAGVDVWLNTPLPPLEASGTSGMKAALNGVPSLSVLDGWWIEGCLEGVTGWSIGDRGTAPEDAGRALYDKLERTVLPLYYRRDNGDAGWMRVMKGAISKNASYFSSHRMMRRYATEAYAP